MRLDASSLDRALRLGFWLGPWSNAITPRGVERSRVASGASAAYLYEDPRRAARGVYLVLPGLHFLGPDDPRLDRFCRILAKSGLLVVAPFIRAYCRLVLDASSFEDAESAWTLSTQLALARGLPAPAAFSISFGSILALHVGAVAADPPSALVLFGGYADFLQAVRFAVTGRTEHRGSEHRLERDPLNSPVVYLNVLDHLDVAAEDRPRLAQAWLEMVYRTWGKFELKRPGARDPIARDIAADLPPRLSTPFMRGCVLDPGAIDWLESGLARAPGSLSFLDPSPLFSRVRSPVVLVHGKGDDVIPYFESIKLSERLPPGCVKSLHLTGMYGHTGASSPGPAALAKEAKTMVSMLADLATAPSQAVSR